MAAGHRRAKKAQPSWRTNAQDPAEIEILPSEVQRVGFVLVRREEHIVVAGPRADSPCLALQVGEKWMRRADLPMLAKGILLCLDVEDVRHGAELIVGVAHAVAVAN